MTGTDSGPRQPLLIAALFACLLCAGGCVKEVDAFPEPGNAAESSRVLRNSATGPIIVTYAPFPFQSAAPEDGVRRAVAAVIGRAPCSAASFHYTEKATAERWLREQMEARRRNGWPVRVILAGHGLGGTEAAETARDIIVKDSSAEIVLLLTVDAVKPGRINYATGAAGAAVTRISGVKLNMSLVAYDMAPAPDGIRFWSHINYYQTQNSIYHGSSMPGAENHLLDDWSGYLNHGNVDDFAFPLLTADLRAAIARGLR